MATLLSWSEKSCCVQQCCTVSCVQQCCTVSCVQQCCTVSCVQQCCTVSCVQQCCTVSCVQQCCTVSCVQQCCTVSCVVITLVLVRTIQSCAETVSVTWMFLCRPAQVLWWQRDHWQSRATVPEEGAGGLWSEPGGMGRQCAASLWIPCQFCRVHGSGGTPRSHHGSVPARRRPPFPRLHDPAEEGVGHVSLLWVVSLQTGPSDRADRLRQTGWECQALLAQDDHRRFVDSFTPPKICIHDNLLQLTVVIKDQIRTSSRE